MTIRHNHTRTIIRVDSHKSGTLYLNDDVVQWSYQKSVKATGRWQATLVPRRNYLNLIHPNDVVNIYVDPGDGERGWTRVCFGYVDRVALKESISDSRTGARDTAYILIGSDFQKAFDKTHIYFNAYLRQILDERFARTSQGSLRPGFTSGTSGVALRNAGITAFGTPADFIENFLLILLGFGQQWQLPDSYARQRPQISENRRTRIQRAKARIPSTTLDLISKLGFDPERLDQEIDRVLEEVQRAGFSTVAESELAAAKERRDAAKALRQNAALLTYRSTLASADPSYPTGLIDALSLDFIESLAIDGFNASDTVWQAGNQTLSQYLYGHSNEIVNELCVDLRPVSQGDQGLVAGDYSRSEDELGINVTGAPGYPADVPGVRYVPAVVMREYPYSVVEGIDLSGVTIFPGGVSPADRTPGFVYFGPIFGIEPNVTGRHTYQYPLALTPERCLFDATRQPVKHIDSVTIDAADIISMEVGRSDNDVTNLMQLFPRGPGSMTDQYRSVLSNFAPIVNQISIARHGLRVREMTTSHANYSRDVDCVSPASVPDSAQVRRNLVRWLAVMDHWYQHNVEYLSGSITLRPLPEIRAGYRLDVRHRSESYYVEQVSQQWAYNGSQPGAGTLQTSVQVSRGQRNDPFPAYVPPVFLSDRGDALALSSGNRGADGRLADYFPVVESAATLAAMDPTQAALDRNVLDTPPNANRGGRAVYPSVGGLSEDLPTLIDPGTA